MVQRILSWTAGSTFPSTDLRPSSFWAGFARIYPRDVTIRSYIAGLAHVRSVIGKLPCWANLAGSRPSCGNRSRSTGLAGIEWYIRESICCTFITSRVFICSKRTVRTSGAFSFASLRNCSHRTRRARV